MQDANAIGKKTYQVPVTEYVWEAFWANRWNPFEEPYIAYRMVPRVRLGIASANRANAGDDASMGAADADRASAADDTAVRGRGMDSPRAGVRRHERPVCPRHRLSRQPHGASHRTRPGFDDQAVADRIGLGCRRRSSIGNSRRCVEHCLGPLQCEPLSPLSRPRQQPRALNLPGALDARAVSRDFGIRENRRLSIPLETASRRSEKRRGVDESLIVLLIEPLEELIDVEKIGA